MRLLSMKKLEVKSLKTESPRDAQSLEACGDPAENLRLSTDQSGATTLEWALLLAAVAIPSYYIIALALETLLGHYRMMTALNALPFP